MPGKNRRNAGLIALEALDIGLPIEVAGREYILLDKLYQRVEVSQGNSAAGHRLLGVELPLAEVLIDLIQEMTEAERFSIATQRTVSKRLNPCHSTLQMLAQARRQYRAMSDQPLSLKWIRSVFDANDNPVEGPLTICMKPSAMRLSSDLSYRPSSDLTKKGDPVHSFEVYAPCQVLAADGEVQGPFCMYLGLADRRRGYLPNVDLMPHLQATPSKKPEPSLLPDEPRMARCSLAR